MSLFDNDYENLVKVSSEVLFENTNGELITESDSVNHQLHTRLQERGIYPLYNIDKHGNQHYIIYKLLNFHPDPTNPQSDIDHFATIKILMHRRNINFTMREFMGKEFTYETNSLHQKYKQIHDNIEIYNTFEVLFPRYDKTGWNWKPHVDTEEEKAEKERRAALHAQWEAEEKAKAEGRVHGRGPGNSVIDDDNTPLAPGWGYYLLGLMARRGTVYVSCPEDLRTKTIGILGKKLGVDNFKDRYIDTGYFKILPQETWGVQFFAHFHNDITEHLPQKIDMLKQKYPLEVDKPDGIRFSGYTSNILKFNSSLPIWICIRDYNLDLGKNAGNYNNIKRAVKERLGIFDYYTLNKNRNYIAFTQGYNGDNPNF